MINLPTSSRMGYSIPHIPGAQIKERKLEQYWRRVFTASSIFSTVAGCLLIGASITLYTDGKYEQYFNSTQHPLVYLLFFVSCFGALAGFLAVCIITIHSYKLLYAMNIMLALVTTAKIAGVCFTLIYRVKTLHGVTTQLEEHMANYSNNMQVQWDLDTLQSRDQCCGVTTPLDWANNTLVQGSWNTSHLPDSCCRVVVPECGVNKASVTVLEGLSLAVHKQGCYQVLRQWFDFRMKVIGVIAGVTSLGEAVMVAISARWIRFIELYW
ncbi:CD63 antigen-like [Bolinopsis microptera]|uniref:CD63 antigen-like n=1 Tax=Bolinopsis microptera TaxID=2820187 RepID=UPI00307AF8A8